PDHRRVARRSRDPPGRAGGARPEDRGRARHRPVARAPGRGRAELPRSRSPRAARRRTQPSTRRLRLRVVAVDSALAGAYPRAEADLDSPNAPPKLEVEHPVNTWPRQATTSRS